MVRKKKNKIYNLGAQIKKRWQSETPKLYKSIRNTATVVTFIIPILGNIDKAPDWFEKSYWYLMSGSAVVAGCSQLTKKTDKDGTVTIETPKKDGQ